MSARVFVSYANADSALAMRVYNDLERSHVEVWRYEKDGKIGVDFEKEIEESIRRSPVFLLLDTAAARASTHVKKEVDLALELEASGGVRILIALGQPEGVWRSRELFHRQNYLRYARLYDYDIGIKDLCGALGVAFIPAFDLPRDIDFEREVSAPELKMLSETRQHLLDTYKKFRSEHDEKGNLRVAKALLIVLLSALEDHGVKLLTPAIALAVMYANAARDADAYQTFADAARAFPDDPRPHAGMGAASFHRHQYVEAAATFEKALRLIERSNERLHIEQWGYVVNFLAKSLLAARRPEEALHALNACPAEHRDTAMSLTRGQVLLALGDAAGAIVSLQNAAESENPEIRLEAQLLLGDAHGRSGNEALQQSILERAVHEHPAAAEPRRRLAALFLHRQAWERAIALLREAVSVEDRLQDRAELGMVLRALGRISEAMEIVRPCLRREARSPLDEYYLGLAHHVAGKSELAQAAYERAVADQQLTDWPYYTDLVQ